LNPLSRDLIDQIRTFLINDSASSSLQSLFAGCTPVNTNVIYLVVKSAHEPDTAKYWSFYSGCFQPSAVSYWLTSLYVLSLQCYDLMISFNKSAFSQTLSLIWSFYAGTKGGHCQGACRPQWLFNLFYMYLKLKWDPKFRGILQPVVFYKTGLSFDPGLMACQQICPGTTSTTTLSCAASRFLLTQVSQHLVKFFSG